MAWRLARSLETLRNQLNAKYPRRDRKSDGTIGDSAHASRASDHNPSDGVVCAFDITNDPANGPDLAKLISPLLADRRTKYVIFDRKIYNPSIQNGAARPYSGANAHKKHLHLSVLWDRKDEAQDWVLAPTGSAPQPVSPPPAKEKPRQILKKGMTGGDVPVLQLRLRELGDYKGLVDGDFGPKTDAAVRAFQARTGLKADGVVGPLTWAKLPSAANSTPPASPPENNTGTNWPKEAIKLYESLGWSHLQAVALVANLVWESGGNQKKPYTIVFDAVGDAGHSHGAGQWNDMPKVQRFQALQAFATKKGKKWTDPETQLLFLDHELHTTERKAGVLLRASTTLEEAVSASLQIWRPSVPHADRRLAIAQALNV